MATAAVEPGPASHAPASPQADTRWHASLALTFGDRTRLVHRRHEGPLYVQRPFYPEGPEVCHVYLLHPPSGLAGGDRLEITARVQPGAHAVLTTPAAGRFYRSSGAESVQRQRLAVAAGGALEWLPQENLFYGASNARVETHINLAPGARFLGWEIAALGRPGSGDHFQTGRLRLHSTIRSGGRLVLSEMQRIDAGDAVRTAAWGLSGCGAFGALYASPFPANALAAIRAVIAEPESGVECAATLMDGLLCLRAAGPDVQALRGPLERALAAARAPITGRPWRGIRIWRT